MKKHIFIPLLLFLFFGSSLFAFDDGFVFGLSARFSGSHTDPHISESDKAHLGAEALTGLTGFIMDGEFEFGYIFDSPTYFGMKDNNIFGGLVLTGFVGVGQGYTGQKTTAEGIDVFMNIYSTPTIRFGSKLKTYLFHNRFALTFGLGGRMIADPNPEYMGYSSNSEMPFEKGVEVGTIIVTNEDMKTMNPFGALFEFGMEYTQPVISTTELVLGGYMSYTIYKPGGISMPLKLKEELEKQHKKKFGTSVPQKFNHYYINSLDFGISIGIRFKA